MAPRREAHLRDHARPTNWIISHSSTSDLILYAQERIDGGEERRVLGKRTKGVLGPLGTRLAWMGRTITSWRASRVREQRHWGRVRRIGPSA